MTTPFQLPYTLAESEAANRDWKASCGHHSIAAATRATLAQVKEACPKLCGWMNPTMVGQTLTGLRVPFTLDPVEAGKHPYLEMVEGNQGKPRIFRVQFDGPWMEGPVAGRYRHTHYIACLPQGIVEPMLNPCVIRTHEAWFELAEDMYKHVVKHCTGFHFTHVWNVKPKL